MEKHTESEMELLKNIQKEIIFLKEAVIQIRDEMKTYPPENRIEKAVIKDVEEAQARIHARKAHVDYDPEEDILSVSTGEKVNDTIEFDQFVIDFTLGDKIVGIEIQDASLYLKKILEIAVDKKSLENVKAAKFSVIQQKEFAFIKVVMLLPVEGAKTEERTIMATAPLAQAAA